MCAAAPRQVQRGPAARHRAPQVRHFAQHREPRARILADRGGRVAVEHRLHVVKRAVRHPACIATARVVGRVRGRIPAFARQVEPADEREPVVDHDELLVMRRAARMRVVEPEADAAVRTPRGAIDGGPVALQRVDHREVPREHVDAQVVPRGRERAQECGERVGQAVAGVGGRQMHLAVDVPADDEDGVARSPQRGAQRREICVAVHQHREAVRIADRVAVATAFEQPVSCRLVRVRGGGNRVVGACRRECGARHAVRHDHRASTSGSPSMRCSSASQRARSASSAGESASIRMRSPLSGSP